MFRWLQQWLRLSPHVHIRQSGPQNLGDLVGLLDRFIFGEMRYPLEWDDFISWKSGYSGIEAFRERLEEVTPLLSSKKVGDLDKAIRLLIDIRNEVAGLVGLPARAPPPPAGSTGAPP